MTTIVPARGEIWWAELRKPVGSEPGYRRPVLVMSADSFNLSGINTVIVVAISSNINLAEAPGNVELAAGDSGLSRDSVVNVSQVLTLDKTSVTDRVGAVDFPTMQRIEAGLQLVLALPG
ncbi:MAG: type II toxin-antitoxin system PemK/MazF family toxin [Acidimicrobiaceae bacterium]|nr:type II toxin-antitoxin system PemK/MazF family toxin [Acidimicrobiaceae bacterium]